MPFTQAGVVGRAGYVSLASCDWPGSSEQLFPSSPLEQHSSHSQNVHPLYVQGRVCGTSKVKGVRGPIRILAKSYGSHPGLADLVRAMSSQASALKARPVQVALRRLPPGHPFLNSFEVEFDDGKKFQFPAEFLRVESPAADSKGVRAHREAKVVSGRRHVGIISVEPVGNYGLRISFDDLHKTGIYSWGYLYYLGEHKYSLMKKYILSLREQGLSRDPSRK